ncbi:hypothetical protein BH23PLA1_BH23PLA1_40330 [soil metagenome]
MLCPPQPPDPVVENWIERHRHPGSFALHMIGIPATVLGVVLIPIYLTLLSVPIFLLSALLFIGGFLLQFLGHALDGTEPGEITFLKRQLGGTVRPAVVRPKSAGRVA